MNPPASHKPATAGVGPTTRAIVLLGGCVLAVGGLIWLTAQIAGLIFGGGWPAAPPQPHARHPRDPRANLDNPAQAWPRRSRGQLPGPMAFYSTLLGLVGVEQVLGEGLASWSRCSLTSSSLPIARRGNVRVAASTWLEATRLAIGGAASVEASVRVSHRAGTQLTFDA